MLEEFAAEGHCIGLVQWFSKCAEALRQPGRCLLKNKLNRVLNIDENKMED